jgi:hypothetical protein
MMRLEGWNGRKNVNGLIGTRTHVLPACSIAPRPCTLLRVSYNDTKVCGIVSMWTFKLYSSRSLAVVASEVCKGTDGGPVLFPFAVRWIIQFAVLKENVWGGDERGTARDERGSEMQTSRQEQARIYTHPQRSRKVEPFVSATYKCVFRQ